MARIKGQSRTETIRPTVTLMSASSNPIGTIVAMWIGSRYKDALSASEIQELYDGSIPPGGGVFTMTKLCEDYPEYAGDFNDDYRSVIENVAKLVFKSNLPPLDALNFTFEINDANVAWREQLVRGRQPQNFWTQTSRTADLSTVDINMSENIEFYGGTEAVQLYKDTVDAVRNAYKLLSEMGVPTEDIRLIPQGMTHRVYWMVPYRTLKTAISKRMSWIAQASLWSPIIEDIQTIMFSECKLMANILGTPADVQISNGKVVKHSYDNENEDRYYGRDPQPCDVLWLAYRGYCMPEHTDIEFFDRMKSYYIKLWSEEVCEIVGWDKSNPTKIGPYDRPYSWFEQNNQLDAVNGLIHNN